MKKLWNGVLGASAAALGGAASFGGVAYTLFSKTMRRGKTPPTSMNVSEDNHSFEEMQKEGREWAMAHKAQCSRQEIVSEGVRLAGYYYQQDSSKTVILVHGFSGSYLDRLCNAGLYFERGYNVLAVDCRGHGESGGKYRTLGYMDGKDLVCWAKFLIKKFNQDFIVLDGVSMGGAAVLVASGEEDLPQEVRGIVSDCAFTSIHDIFEHQLKHFLKLPVFPLIHVVEWYCRKLAKVSPTENSPLECVRRAQVPILFIHGIRDDYVPFEMGAQLNRECPFLKKLLTVRKAGHAECCKVAPELYSQTLQQFLETLEL